MTHPASAESKFKIEAVTKSELEGGCDAIKTIRRGTGTAPGPGGYRVDNVKPQKWDAWNTAVGQDLVVKKKTESSGNIVIVIPTDHVFRRSIFSCILR